MLIKAAIILVIQFSCDLQPSFNTSTDLITNIELDEREKKKAYLVKQAVAYKGTTYVSGGESFMEGFDCSGLTKQLYKGTGINLPHSAKLQSQLGKPVSRQHLEPGDLLFFSHGEGISHVAMVLSHNQKGTHIVHATSSKGVIFETLEQSRYWTEKYQEARRLF